MSGYLIMPMDRQRVWGLPVIVNFALGGSAAGWYILMMLLNNLTDTSLKTYPDQFKIAAPILVALGFSGLALKIRSLPEKSAFLFYNFRSSWMSRECVSGFLFCFFAVADYVFPHSLLSLLAASAAIGFLASQSLLVYHAKAVTSWHISSMPLMLFFSSLYGGVGWVLMTVAVSKIHNLFYLSAFFFACIFLNAFSWFYHIFKIKAAGRHHDLKSPRFQNIILVFLLPMFLYIFWILSFNQKDFAPGLDVAVKGLLGTWMIVFSMYQKAKLIRIFSFLIPLELSSPESIQKM